ncbi:MAG: L-glutamate gamma-semialdehyde dehydrogenase [Deltaproteobacteria bacterium]|nr:L-glutamate gamma-semialdehyde dehydrogenase [Deltaproteobacteria bacterium]
MRPFKNEPFADFSVPKNRLKMENSLAHVKTLLGQEYPLIIADKKIKATETFVSYNPAQTGEQIGIFQKGTTELCAKAMESALLTFESWKNVPAPKRAQFLFKMAHLMRQKKEELCAWLIYEVGKSWREADGDVCEAIDFLEYYGREMLRLSASPTRGPKLASIPSEKNKLHYIPLGVGVIIAPWNFPLAILVGMSSAAIVTGNTVVIKPSTDAPTIAYQFMKIAEEAGLPPGVINFVSGSGSVVGNFLIKHPKTRFISFTGSKDVGIQINELASRVPPDQKWLKRVVLEMGGKDGIIVDREADLEAAAEGIVRSAFGFQGQKCSACSRAIIDEKIYDQLVSKIVQKTEQLKIGNPKDPAVFLGPIINEASLTKTKEYLEIGKREGKLLTGGEAQSSPGYFVKPTIFGDVSPKARLAQEEIFAPVLALIKAKDFDEALTIANNTDYGLTGAVYTKNPKKIKKAQESFHVGNLYINRGCTGALVGVHPFGGFNLSGTDSKAGGPDYLLLFMQAKSISERSLK